MQQLKYDNLNGFEKKRLLLRTLGIELHTITRLMEGEVLLGDVLQTRIEEIINNPNDTTQCAIVCQNIKRDGASYETLDPDPYLDHINEMIARGGTFCEFNDRDKVNSGVNFDTIKEAIPNIENKPVFAIYAKPFVRFFARTFDIAIYMVVVGLCFRLILGVNPLQDTTLMAVYMYTIYAFMLILEPLFLHNFGTTPGKWIFGIKILSTNGQKLGFKEAYLRSFRLLRFGYGFMIPFYNFFRMGMSLLLCKKRQPLPWDFGLLIAAPERTKPKHIGIYIAAFLAVTMLDTGIGMFMEIPRQSGALTETVFNDNCAHIVKYDAIRFTDLPDYSITTDANGIVTSVTYTVDVSDSETIYPFYNEMIVAYLATVSNSKDFGTLKFNNKIVPEHFRNCFTDFEFEYAGYRATNKVEFDGYARNILAGYLYQTSGSEVHTFRQEFTITKIN